MPGLNAPYFGGRIIAAGYDEVAVDLEATDAGLMPIQDFFELSGHEIPDSEGSVTRARYGCLSVRHFQASYGGSVTAKGVNTRAVPSQYMRYTKSMLGLTLSPYSKPGHHDHSRRSPEYLPTVSWPKHPWRALAKFVAGRLSH